MRIQIRTNFVTPSGGNKSTLEVEPSDTVRDVIHAFVKQEGIRTNGCWSGLCLPGGDYLPPRDTLSKHGVQSGNTLEYHKGRSVSGHGSALHGGGDPEDTIRIDESSCAIS